MIISKSQLTNCGDRRMAELTVDRGGELELITIDGEIIIGYNSDNKMLWFAVSWQDLVRHIGAANAVSVYKQFKAVWKWPSDIEDECDIQALESLMDFVSSANRLSENWRYFLNKMYPFAEDFESLLIDLAFWQYEVIKAVENGDWED